jgi:hypothetical protein
VFVGVPIYPGGGERGEKRKEWKEEEAEKGKGKEFNP